MTLNSIQTMDLLNTLRELQEMKLPFKISLVFAKNIKLLEKENEFFTEQEREFAMKYLEIDPETQQFVESAPGVFKIKEDMIEECQEARKALNDFTVDVDLKKLKAEDFEKFEFTPKQVAGLELIIDEEE